jgi:hypothetical protein
VELVATPARGLEGAQETRLLELLEGHVREATQLLAGGGPLAEAGEETADAVEVAGGVHRALLGRSF